VGVLLCSGEVAHLLGSADVLQEKLATTHAVVRASKTQDMKVCHFTKHSVRPCNMICLKACKACLNITGTATCLP
jgi:hypothetical protein